jgi:hypothetical protein
MTPRRSFNNPVNDHKQIMFLSKQLNRYSASHFPSNEAMKQEPKKEYLLFWIWHFQF